MHLQLGGDGLNMNTSALHEIIWSHAVARQARVHTHVGADHHNPPLSDSMPSKRSVTAYAGNLQLRRYIA
jgi:hypothetical protein